MKSRIRTFSLSVLGLSLLASSASAQLDYQVRVDTESKTWAVQCQLDNPSGEDFDFWLARWTAGAYHRADYGRFVTEFEAFDADGKALQVERQGETHFSVGAAGHGKITLRYGARSMSHSLFADGVIDVEANRVEEDYGYLNPVSLLGFVPDRVEEPYSVRFDLPEGWQVATILEADAAGAYHAPSYYRMEDSPFLFSPTLQSVDLEAGGKGLTVSAHGVSEEGMEELVEDCYELVEATSRLLGGLPYENYEFLFGFVPSAGGSGLEHSYSTLILFNTRSPIRSVRGITSHEFFHLFCAERIHVQELQKPDYTKTLSTGTIWVNESITEYLSTMVLAYAGMETHEKVLAGFTQTNLQLNGMRQSGMVKPGPEASRNATDWEDMNALMSFASSVYNHGSRVMFALDMEMRRGSRGKVGLVHLVKHLLAEYVDKDRGFPEDGMLDIINHVAGRDMSDFYSAHIEALEPLDMNAHLSVIGYGLRSGRLIELKDATPEQLSARENYFSAGN